MSYGFNVNAKSKAEAKAKVAEQLAAVVAGQAVHENDSASAQAAADALIDLLAEAGDREEVTVSVQGYLTWRAEGEFVQARVEVVAGLITLPVQAAEG